MKVNNDVPTPQEAVIKSIVLDNLIRNLDGNAANDARSYALSVLASNIGAFLREGLSTCQIISLVEKAYACGYKNGFNKLLKYKR